MAIEVGSAFVTILPSARGFSGSLNKQISGPVAASGQTTGKRWGGGFASAGLGMLKTGLFAGVATGFAGLAAGATWGLKVAAQNEQAQISFETMLGSAAKAKGFLDDLQKFAASTPFEFPELQTAASSLISAGVQAGKVIPIMTTLGDVTSGMGTGAEGVQRATIALQQMNAAGKITGEDLNQLRDAGVPVYDLLAAATGRSKAAVTELAAKGKLGAKDLGALMKALETGKGLERFRGLMDKQSMSLTGMLSTFKDTFGQGLATAIKPALPTIKTALAGITRVSDAFFKGVGGVATGPLTGLAATAARVGGALRGIVTGLVTGTAKGKGYAGQMQTVGVRLREAFAKVGDWVRTAVGHVREFFASATSGDTEGIKAQFAGIGDALVKLGPAVQAFLDNMPTFQQTLSVAGTVMGFLADHVDTLAKYMPLLVAAFVAYKAAQATANVVSLAAIPLQLANLVVNRQLAVANATLAAQLSVVTGVENVSLITRLRTTAATIASAVASKVAAGAARIWAAGQWLLNAALTANPIGLVVLAIAALVGGLVFAYTHSERFRAIVQAAFGAVLTAARAVLGFFADHWKTILVLLTGPVGIAIALIIRHWGAIKAAMGRLVSAVASGISAAVRFVTGLPGKAAAALRSLGSRIFAAARSGFDKLKLGASISADALIGFVQGIPARIISGLGNLGGMLLGVGQDIVRGLIDGIKSMAGEISSTLVGILPGPVKKFAGKLGINSPSTVFAGFGQDVAAGFALGITDGVRQVGAATDTLAGAATFRPSALPGIGMSAPTLGGDGASLAPQVRVFIGERELTDIVRVEVDGRDAALSDAFAYRRA
jgi:tape measure domain-containing protein